MRRRLSLAAATLLWTSHVLAQGAPSPELQAVIDALPEDQRAFLADEEKLASFGMTPDKLYILLAGRDAATVSTTIAAMMATLAAAPFQAEGMPVSADGPSELDPAGDMAAVPLNTTAPSFNGGTVLSPAVLDQYQRDPGPINLKRYLYETDGIPTFAGAPVAVRTEDLVAGGVDIAFVGVPMGLSSGWRDAQNAPDVLRAMHGIGGYDIATGFDPLTQLSVVDYGDFSVNRMAAELSIDHVRTMIGAMVEVGVVPFIVGGDHTVMFPSVAAMADKHGVGGFEVVHFDAHYNAEQGLDHTISDRQVVYRLLQQGIIEGDNLTQIGIRGAVADTRSLAWFRDQGVAFHTMAQVEAEGWDTVAQEVTDRLEDSTRKIFISFDMSALDPAYGQAAGRPVSGGLTMREVLPMMRQLCTRNEVVGFELLDLAPMLDLSYASALNANQIMNACLIGIALRDAEG